jgi:threonine dehydrogenase-like Zn-dependent dehydrogenase
MEAGALVEPLAVGWHAVKCSPMRAGDTVLILGGGPIGLSVIQAAKAKGAGKIIVSEVAERRKEYATEFGADLIIDPVKEDIVARIREITKGKGVDVVYDAAGVQVCQHHNKHKSSTSLMHNS